MHVGAEEVEGCEEVEGEDVGEEVSIREGVGEIEGLCVGEDVRECTCDAVGENDRFSMFA